MNTCSLRCVSTRRAAIYARISDARDGDTAGVARQEADARALADRLGWTVATVYVENNTSAFKRRRITRPDGSTAYRVVRPEFRRMLGDLTAGTVDALVAYDLDRVARDPRDLEDLVDLVEQQQVAVRSVTGSLRLDTDADVTMARVMVAIANKASKDTARRVVRKQQELAEQGRPKGGGVRGYGYEADGMTVIDAEAAILREIAARIIDGDSLSSIARDLTARGVPAVRADRWNTRSVHAAVTKPRVAGLRTHRGQVVGDAVWPAILDRDTWEAVLAALAARPKGSNRLARWLTGVLVCDLCGQPLVGTTGNSGPRYWCAPAQSTRGRSAGCGRIAISGDRVEALTEKAILGYLSEPHRLALLAAEVSADRAHALRGDLAGDEAQLVELAEAYAARAITMPEYLAARRVVEARLEDTRRLLAAATPAAVRQLVTAADIKTTWVGYQPGQKRDVARTLWPQGVPVRAPGPVAGPMRWDPQRVRFWEPLSADVAATA